MNRAERVFERVKLAQQLLVAWIYDDKAVPRLDQVVAVLIGGEIFAPHFPMFSRFGDRTITVAAEETVCGMPRLNTMWRDAYHATLRCGAGALQRKREFIVFCAVLDSLQEALLALAPIRIPCYVLVEILDFLPFVNMASRHLKIYLIETLSKIQFNRENSGKNGALVRRRQRHNYAGFFDDEYDRHWKSHRCVMNALIVLKGYYSGTVRFNVGPQPCARSLPGICGENSLLYLDDDKLEIWRKAAATTPILDMHFSYLYVQSGYWF